MSGSVGESDESMTIRTVMDLRYYDHEGKAAVFQQRLAPDHEGTWHSFAMADGDWNALGRPKAISMTFSVEEPPI